MQNQYFLDIYQTRISDLEFNLFPCEAAQIVLISREKGKTKTDNKRHETNLDGGNKFLVVINNFN